MRLDTDATTADTYTVTLTEDPAAFLDEAEEHLAADPVLTTVVSSVTHRALADPVRGALLPNGVTRWWAVVKDDHGVAGVAMRTAPFAPYPLFVLPMADAAAVALARDILARGEEVGGVNGALPAARTVAAELARATGGTTAVAEHTRLFELGELAEPPPPPGSLRAATAEHVDLALAWFQAFEADADEQAGRVRDDSSSHLVGHIDREDMLQRVADRRVWLWHDDEGTPVHLTGFNPPSFGVARVGPVYTPREHRGRGYASAAVAGVSRRLLDEGARVCLFTDQANPTSNKVYQAIGFRPVVDMANLLVLLGS
jgi:RimJ/RimL family protein N-acetyltransferase